METVGSQNLYSFAGGGSRPIKTTCEAVRKSEAYRVNGFLQLAACVADLQYRNRDLVLMFRGQGSDHVDSKGRTSLKPRIFRPSSPGRVPTDHAISRRYLTLNKAESLLASHYSKDQSAIASRIRRQQILRWAILQHYEVCDTPLLDVTQSLRIAASFASEAGQRNAYLMVIGIPNVSGAITASAEAGLQIVRLASVCPPQAIRPHIQEGYLLGEYPEMISAEHKKAYRHYEIDFGRRLVAKFTFRPSEFWVSNAEFPPVSRSALYPEEDPMLKISESIASSLSSDAS